MKILVFGYHNVGYECLKVLIKKRENIVAVFTHQDNPQENIWFKSVQKLAFKNKIKVYEPENINTPENIALIKSLAPDIIFSFYYRQLICDEILQLPKLSAFNMHGSLLPKYRGRCPVNWVLVNGEKKTGVTLHKMITKADAGDILAQKKIKILFKDDAYTLFNKITKASAKVLEKGLTKIKNRELTLIPQNHKNATYFGGRKPEDGKINWNDSVQNIYNLIRGVTYPYPGAFTFYKGKKLIIWKAEIINKNKKNKKFGKIIKFTDKNIVVSCGKGRLKILKKNLNFYGRVIDLKEESSFD